MSVQLILYPQNYDGNPNSISGNSTEFIVDGINFSTINSTTNYSASSVNGAVSYFTPMIANDWNRFTTAAASSAVELTNQLRLVGEAGVMQKLSNLTVGTVYDVTIDIDNFTGTAYLVFYHFTGTTINSLSTLSSAAGIVTVQFTANSTSDTVVFKSSGSGSLAINSISVLQAAASPSGSIENLASGQVICDLYEDEDIPLSLSVDDFKNVAEQVQSYSKAFNLPATKRNNRIFDQIFEITRSDDGVIFNPYKKSQCVLKQDGFILFEGYLRLLDVTDKEGEISYNVNLYSEVVALADVLKQRQFSDLDFTELEHDYTVTQVQLSWNDAGGGSGMTYTNPSTSGFRQTYGTVRYPFVNWNNQYTIHPTSVNLPNLESTFRPFINIKYLVDRIFNAPDTPFSYTSDFFGAADFEKMYMDFNWGSDNAPVVFSSSASGDWDSWQSLDTSWTTIEFPINTFSNMPELPYSLGVFTATYDNQMFTVSTQMVFDWLSSANSTLNVEWVVTDGSGVETIYFASGNQYNNNVPYIYQASFFGFLQTGDTLHCRAIETGSNMVLEDDPLQFMNITTSSSETTNETLLDTLRGELGQWDFLKGLMTMFNLVALADPDNPNTIKIEPYADVFINSTDSVQLDWTDKIDVSEMKLTPLADLNKKTIFKFVEDDDDFAFTNYKNQVGGHLYGSKKYDAGNEFNILQGEDEVVAEPFAATVIKPLMPQYPQLITPALYSYNADDGTSEGFDNSPRIMYNNEIKATGIDCYVPAQNGSGAVYLTNFLQFSHLSDVPTVAGSLDFHFGECQLLVGASTPNNLFNLYWLPYYSELYNPNTRIMTIKVNLTPADINTFKFNDTVFLKNRVFRVNKIDYKPNDLATVEFILIP